MKVPSRFSNPTKTGRIQKSWFAEINRRYSKFSKDAVEKLREITAAPLAINAEVGINASQQRIYMAWLMQEIELLTGAEPPNNWQNVYQLESYQRGLERTRESLISQGARMTLTEAERMAAQGLTSFTAIPSLTTTLSVATMAPIHQEGLEFLFTRSYESLKGWNDSLAKEVRQITFDAVRNGDGVTETAKKIRDRTGVAKSRAQNIAATETISAYRESSIAETQRASEELGEEIDMRWITAHDNRVRHLHAGFHGTISTPEETRRKGNISPYRCRCAQIPVIKGINDTPSKNEKFKEERASLLKMEASKKAG